MFHGKNRRTKDLRLRFRRNLGKILETARLCSRQKGLRGLVGFGQNLYQGGVVLPAHGVAGVGFDRLRAATRHSKGTAV